LLLLSGCLGLLLLLLDLLNLLLLRTLRVPLSCLQHQHTNKHKRQDGVARSVNPQCVLPADEILSVLQFNLLALRSRDFGVAIDTRRHNPEALHDVGEVHSYASHVEDERRAVEEHVGFRRLEQLDQEAQKTGANDKVENARDDGRRGVEELDMPLEQVEVLFAALWRRRPEHIVVVREGCEENAEEETCGCRAGQLWCARDRFARGPEPAQVMLGHVRATTMNWAKLFPPIVKKASWRAKVITDAMGSFREERRRGEKSKVCAGTLICTRLLCGLARCAI
jgi:hypothetical protein